MRRRCGEPDGRPELAGSVALSCLETLRLRTERGSHNPVDAVSPTADCEIGTFARALPAAAIRQAQGESRRRRRDSKFKAQAVAVAQAPRLAAILPTTGEERGGQIIAR